MWIFAPGGLLMPATFPRAKVDPTFVPEGSDYDLQIRVRAVSHLENFIRDYLTPMGLEHSAIQKTPMMDYNARIYMRRSDFAVAVGQMVLDIDYDKFKPTAEDRDADGKPLYAEGKEYHSVLNSIWGTVTRLGRPGGVWRTYKGGKYGATYRSTMTRGEGRWSDSWDAWDNRWGTYDERDMLTDDVRDTDRLLEMLDANRAASDSFPDYVPDTEERREQVLFNVEGIPASQWDEFLDEEELDLVRGEYRRRLDDEFLEVREARAEAKRRRKTRRGKHAARRRASIIRR